MYMIKLKHNIVIFILNGYLSEKKVQQTAETGFVGNYYPEHIFILFKLATFYLFLHVNVKG